MSDIPTEVANDAESKRVQASDPPIAILLHGESEGAENKSTA